MPGYKDLRNFGERPFSVAGGRFFNVAHLPKPGCIGQTANVKESLALYAATAHSTRTWRALVGGVSVASECRRRGRGLGIESTADVLLTKPPKFVRRRLAFKGFAGKTKSRRADLRTAYPCSSYEFACARSRPSYCVRKLRFFVRFSMIRRSRFVHCVPVRIREGCSTWVVGNLC